jgi:hypothetical protein
LYDDESQSHSVSGVLLCPACQYFSPYQVHTVDAGVTLPKLMECAELATWLLARSGSVRHVLLATLVVPEMLLHASTSVSDMQLSPEAAAAQVAPGSAGTTLRFIHSVFH